MPIPQATRKARFKAALALARMTAESWALQEGITPGYLSHILAGRFKSRSLNAKIDAFTKRYLGNIAA